MNRTAEPTRRPITAGDRQANLCPPYCNASSKQHTAPSKIATPKGSSCHSFDDSGSFPLIFPVSLNFRKVAVRAIAIAPIGRFLRRIISRQFRRDKRCIAHYIQKHHLQPALSTRTPPTIGLADALIPKVLATSPM